MSGPRVGVLALQGDFAKHAAALAAVGAEPVEVRVASQLDSLDGLVLPGGESTALLKLMEGTTFLDSLRQFHGRGRAIYGTCAGVILLASRVKSPAQASLGVLDVEVQRNGYGRQIESFEAEAAIPVLGNSPFPLIFIRAPVITAVGPEVSVLAEWKSRPVMVQSGRILATTFHPELTDDRRVHQLFVAMCQGAIVRQREEVCAAV